MQDIEEEPRMFYFTENDRLFCGTRSMSISTIEVKDILDCPQSQYDISEKVYNFDTHRDRAMYASKIDTEFLAKHLGVPLKFWIRHSCRNKDVKYFIVHGNNNSQTCEYIEDKEILLINQLNLPSTPAQLYRVINIRKFLY